MNEIIPVMTSAKRRRFAKVFKAKIVAACNQPDASVAGVALANGLNANLVHRWQTGWVAVAWHYSHWSIVIPPKKPRRVISSVMLLKQ